MTTKRVNVNHNLEEPRRYQSDVPLPTIPDNLEGLIEMLRQSGDVRLSVTWEMTEEFDEFDLGAELVNVEATYGVFIDKPRRVS